MAKRPCGVPGCTNLAGRYLRKCYDHAFANWTFREVVAATPRTDKPVRNWDVICLLCADRRVAHGTEDQARVTMAGLPPCAKCGGPLIVENSDVGNIGSPSAVHSAVYQPGYGVSTKPKAAA